MNKVTLLKLNTSMISRNIFRLISRKRHSLTDTALETDVLCNAETSKIKPCIYLKHHIENIKSLSPWRDWETENRLISGGVSEHAATISYTIENVAIANGFVYSGNSKMQAGYGKETSFISPSIKYQHFDHVSLVSSRSGSHYFGPHLRDDLPLALITEEDKIRVQTKFFRHSELYREISQAPCSPVIQCAHIRRLTFFQDFSQNSFKERRYRQIRRNMQSRVTPCLEKKAIQGVYIKRGNDGESRELKNEPEVIRFLERQGFLIVNPDSMDALSIFELSFDAPIVVSVEGSQLSHSMYSIKDGGTFLVIQPPTRFSLTHKEYTDCMHLSFSFLVGIPSEHGFNVNIDELDELLDRVVAYQCRADF